MTARFFISHNVAVAASYSAPSQADYPATNLLTPRVGLPWRSLDLTGGDVILDLGVSKTVKAIAIQDTNTADITVYADNAPSPTTYRGDLMQSMDRSGRNKALFIHGSSFGARYVRLAFFDGPTDDLTYYRAGAIYVFSSESVLPRDPIYPVEIGYNEPMTAHDLPNGQDVPVNRGPNYHELRLDFALRPDQDVEFMRRQARAGVCWLDLGLVYGGLSFPVMHVESRGGRMIERQNRETVSVPLREVV